jgi:hypothetical protein
VVAGSTVLCEGVRPVVAEVCDAGPCPTLFWRSSGAWSPCSLPCVVNDTAEGRGVSVSAPAECVMVMPEQDGGEVVVADGECAAAGLVMHACPSFLSPFQYRRVR